MIDRIDRYFVHMPEIPCMSQDISGAQRSSGSRPSPSSFSRWASIAIAAIGSSSIGMSSQTVGEELGAGALARPRGRRAGGARASGGARRTRPAWPPGR